LLPWVHTGSSDATQRVRGTFLQTTDALAPAGAVSCLERSAVHDTRAYYLLFRADCDLSGRMAGRSGSLETYFGSSLPTNRPTKTNGIVRDMLGKIIAASTVIAGIILIIMLQMTHPSTVGPLGLLAVFFLLYIVILGATTELLWVGSHMIQVVGRRFTAKRPPRRLSLQKAYYYSSVLALGPIMSLAMLSIGSFGFYEMVLITVFLAVALLYVSRRSSH